MKTEDVAITGWIALACISVTALAEAPELHELPTFDNHLKDSSQPDTQTTASETVKHVEQTKANEPDNSNPATTRKLSFQRLLHEMSISRADGKPDKSTAEFGIGINPPWSRYLTPLVEYLYYGDSRHSVFYSSEDGKSNSLRESEQMSQEYITKRANQPRQKINCTLRAASGSTNSGVVLVNDTALQQLLRSEKSDNDSSTQASGNAMCQILLLFAPWCPFSAVLAPHYNALGRIYPDLEALAINAVMLNYWNARFGTVAVPSVLLFHNGKFIAKYNYTEKNIESLTYFIQNFTNLNTSHEQIKLTDEDFLGPVPTELVNQTDYYLVLSWAVIVYALAFGCYKYSAPLVAFYQYINNMLNYDHHHLD